ncbi:hypothetical protein FRC07_004938 [Ceratobasidium sp. 392]|nr:hypothetical protein FRC07_004938 [Ceratobasidium sp. 392]
MVLENPGEYPEEDIGDYEELEPETYTRLIEQVSRACPRIESLQLFPLSHLEELSLRTSGATRLGPDSITVPNDSFPSLRKLFLIGLKDCLILEICEVTPLFRQLTRADIVFPQTHRDTLGTYSSSTAVVQPMGQSSPHLWDLSIHPRGRDSGGLLISLPVINAFKYMPLRRLRLGRIIFGPCNDGFEEGDEVTQNDPSEVLWTVFLTTVPGLEELYLGNQNITPQELGWFASLLPRLRLLVIKNVPLDEVELYLPDRASAAQSIVIRSSSFFASPEVRAYRKDQDKIDNIARYRLITMLDMPKN